MRQHRKRLIFLDETTTNTKMTKASGRCLKGERLHAKAPFGHWGTQTLIAGLKCDGLVAPWVINAPMNRVIFDTYIETQLAPILKPGDVVLTQGTGGVSIFALQIAKAAGATVISTSSSDEKLARLKDLGADHLINYKTDTAWGRTAAEIAGRGVDAVIEVGGPGTLNQSITACRIGGHISLIGVLTGWAGEVQTALQMSKSVAVRGITVGSREDQDDMIAAIEANGIKPVIDSTFPLDDIAGAFAHQRSQKHFGKICLEI